MNYCREGAFRHMNITDATDLTRIQALRPGSLVNGVYIGTEVEMTEMPNRLEKLIGSAQHHRWLPLLLPSILWECLGLSLAPEQDDGFVFRACLYGRCDMDRIASLEILEGDALIKTVLGLWNDYLNATCTLKMAREKWWPLAVLCMGRNFEVSSSAENAGKRLWALDVCSGDGDPPLVITLAEAWEGFVPASSSDDAPAKLLCENGAQTLKVDANVPLEPVEAWEIKRTRRLESKDCGRKSYVDLSAPCHAQKESSHSELGFYTSAAALIASLALFCWCHVRRIKRGRVVRPPGIEEVSCDGLTVASELELSLAAISRRTPSLATATQVKMPKGELRAGVTKPSVASDAPT